MQRLPAVVLGEAWPVKSDFLQTGISAPMSSAARANVYQLISERRMGVPPFDLGAVLVRGQHGAGCSLQPSTLGGS